ncbi:hypothetical protein H6F98_00450 [Microcoleus sp. FACHB-SPT15]|uniref:hypothetical protein n=1 Tax=Microcoleus sp. FACHB-SPT15 TaxID=2692830 RepID=UPI00177EA65C|nr:hypothetical protein [Microcoleus sp. FACHB-SPT15]MBD1803950.1 hypothetical protein [Microcoleus sp. FACHB-SPT15]
MPYFGLIFPLPTPLTRPDSLTSPDWRSALLFSQRDRVFSDCSTIENLSKLDAPHNYRWRGNEQPDIFLISQV